MKGYVPARIDVELYGVRAYLEGNGCGNSALGRYWHCDDPKIRTILDGETAWCIGFERLIQKPPWFLLSNWAIEAGQIIAKRVGAKIISIRPMKEPVEPMDLPPDAVV